MATNSKTTKPCGTCTTSAGAFSRSLKIVSINSGVGSEPRQAVLAAEEIRGHDVGALGRGGFVETVGARLAQQRVGRDFGGVLRLFLFDFAFDLALHLGQRLDVSFLLVFDADDVEPVAALHQVAGLSLGERERRLFEFRNGAAAADPAQFAAVLGAAWIVGILRRQFREIAARLHLLQNVFGFLDEPLRRPSRQPCRPGPAAAS